MRILIRILKKLSLLNSFNLMGYYPPDKTMKIPVIKSLGYDNFFEPEPWLVSLLRKILGSASSQDYFIDVGVNVGQTLLKVKLVNRSISYFGFEPNPSCLFYLYELIRVNDFQNVTIFPFALSDSSGVIDLNLYTTNATDSTASIVQGFRRKSTNKIKVPVLNGREVLQLQTIKIGVIKIDVEGGELEVINGMLSFIQRDRPLIICEILPVYNAGNVFRLTRQEQLEAILESASYKIARIDNCGGVAEINLIGVNSDIDLVNYLLFPEEKRELLQRNMDLL